MIPLKSSVLWLLIVAASIGIGSLNADKPLGPPDGPEPLIAFGAVGVGTASCVLIGLFIIRRVRGASLPRFLAAVLVLLTSALSILVPIPIIRAAALATPYRGSEGGYHLFQGEHAQYVFVIFYGFWIALALFIAFTIRVLTVRKCPAQPGASPNGGLATPSTDSAITGGPPSVS